MNIFPLFIRNALWHKNVSTVNFDVNEKDDLLLLFLLI